MGVYAQNKIDKKCLTKKLDVDNNFRKPIFCLENLHVIAQCNTFFKEDFVMIVFVKALFLSFFTTFLIQQLNEPSNTADILSQQMWKSSETKRIQQTPLFKIWYEIHVLKFLYQDESLIN